MKVEELEDELDKKRGSMKGSKRSASVLPTRATPVILVFVSPKLIFKYDEERAKLDVEVLSKADLPQGMEFHDVYILPSDFKPSVRSRWGDGIKSIAKGSIRSVQLRRDERSFEVIVHAQQNRYIYSFGFSTEAEACLEGLV